MTPSDTPLVAPDLLPEARGVVARQLADAFERVAAELRGAEYAPGETRGTVQFLEAVARDVLRPESSAREDEPPEETPGVESLVDPGAVKRALRGIQELQRSVLQGVLERAEIGGDTASEVRQTFDGLVAIQNRLIDHWFDNESLREAELLSQVFHDLRSPLTSVLFLSDALYSGQSGPLSEPQTRQVQLIYAASLTLLTLTENVLNSRNLEAGEVEPERVPFSLAAISDEVERITRPLAEQKELELEFQTRCETSRIGDPDALRRVLLNLVTNAISYTEEGAVTVRFREQEEDLVILVEDSGPGMNDEELAHLFTPFRAAGKEGKPRERRFSGAGLGLSICHRLTRLMEGDIWVDTELGEGSCFGVQVPFPPIEKGGKEKGTD